MGDNSAGSGAGLPMGGGATGGMGLAMAAARRRAIRQTMRPPQIKHGLVKEPHIQHPRDNTGPAFGVGGGFKSAGF